MPPFQMLHLLQGGYIEAFLTTGFTEIGEGIDHETTKHWDVTIGMFLMFSESKLL